MKRSLGVTIIAIFNVLSGIIGVLIGVGILASDGRGSLHDTSFAIGRTLLGILLSVLAVIAGIGVLRLAGWAWMLTLILQGVGILLVPISFIGGQGSSSTIVTAIGTVTIGVIVIAYLLQPRIRARFGRVTTSSASPSPRP